MNLHPYYSSLAASFHYLALAIGLGALFMRGRYLRQGNLSNLFIADNFWGIAALLWIITGSLRAFGGLEKGTAYYLYQPLFWVKMGLFVLLLVCELKPMITFIGWRIQAKKRQELSTRQLKLLILLNDFETALVVIIPFVASAMAHNL